MFLQNDQPDKDTSDNTYEEEEDNDEEDDDKEDNNKEDAIDDDDDNMKLLLGPRHHDVHTFFPKLTSVFYSFYEKKNYRCFTIFYIFHGRMFV